MGEVAAGRSRALRPRATRARQSQRHEGLCTHIFGCHFQATRLCRHPCHSRQSLVTAKAIVTLVLER